MSRIQLLDVTATYGKHTALDGLDLNVPEGSLTALLGPSGCGKTTAVRVIAGFHRVATGSVRIGDRVVDDADTFVRPEKRTVAVVPQDVALFPNLDVAGNVGYGIRKWGRFNKDRVAHLLAMVGLPDSGKMRVHQLSGGQQQRVAVARAMAPQPSAVMLDEPFGALDPGLREAVRRDVRKALQEAGTTAVLVTHDQEEALSLCDEVALMRDGRLVQQGRPADVYERPATLWAARFLGDVVELPIGSFGDRAGATSLGDRAEADTSSEAAAAKAPSDLAGVDTPLGRLPVEEVVNDSDYSGQDLATVRPEQLRRDPDGVSATVTGVEYYGHDAMASLTVHGPRGPADLRWRVEGHAVPKPGEQVPVSVAGGVRVFRAA